MNGTESKLIGINFKKYILKMLLIQHFPEETRELRSKSIGAWSHHQDIRKKVAHVRGLLPK